MSKNKEQPTPQDLEEQLPKTEEPQEECPAKDPQPPLPEAAQKEMDALKDQLMRTLAEYDNFRKRSQRERDAIFPDAEAGVLAKLLPIVDNFERAMACECADAEFKKGMDMIFHSFTELLTTLGVEPVGAAGEPFDPKLHNAVMHVEDDTMGENVVAEVLQKGYRRGDRILRFAMVKTAN